jgi:signal transduction histidine kinase
VEPARPIGAEVALDRRKTEFVAMLAHDMRSPMSVIRGFADLLINDGERLGPARSRDALQAISDGIARLDQLLDGILQLATLDATVLRYQLEAVDLGRLVGEVIASVVPHERVTDVSVTATGEPAVVLGDHDRLWQVVSNLLSNAVKFSSVGTPIEVDLISSADPASPVELAVSDRGVGIRMADVAQMFEPFSRVLIDHGPATRGSGLGLYIARQLVEAQAGMIGAAPRVGGGSRFWLRLRRWAPAEEPTASR